MSDQIAALLPVKPLAYSKSRLASVLSPVDRRDLMLWMADHVLRALVGSGALAQIYLVTADPDVVELGRCHSAVIVEEPTRGLNRALETARRQAVLDGAEACLAVLGDLPRLSPQEVLALVGRLNGPSGMVIAPDSRHEGTNALLLRPPELLPFAFGRHSYSAHLAAARDHGAAAAVFQSPGLSFDLDTPADLDEFRRAAYRGELDPVTADSTEMPKSTRHDQRQVGLTHACAAQS
ncbi:MAG: 2-phospho-L-lactate guanylyltransferase [Chloroflexota bacterium]|nr:2-phospho-L-lactate guanylyltransferase [Chloroflexota bacterium]